MLPLQERGVEILYHNLLRLILENSSIFPGEILVMAPNIEEYAPAIEGIIRGAEQSELEFHISNLGSRRQSEIWQGFLFLLDLSEGSWNQNGLLHFLAMPHFNVAMRFQIMISNPSRNGLKQHVFGGEMIGNIETSFYSDAIVNEESPRRAWLERGITVFRASC